MIEQKDVISFFDRCAPNWDAEMIRNEPVIRTILDNAGIRAGVDVLDVACGTVSMSPQRTVTRASGNFSAARRAISGAMSTPVTLCTSRAR